MTPTPLPAPLAAGQAQTHQPGKVFIKKDKTFLSIQAAWEKYTESQTKE